MKLPGESSLPTSYAAFNVRINAYKPEQYFARYRQAGFLPAEKSERLTPHLPLVFENWRKAMRAGELIHWFASYDDGQGAWGSLSCWRSTHTGWHTQHLVSIGSPLASRAVMLAAQAVSIADGLEHAHQNWFLPENRFAQKLFGSMADALGPDVSAVMPHEYLDVPLAASATQTGADGFVARSCTASDREELCNLVRAIRGDVYVAAEELRHDDLLLDGVDQLYAKVGLRRYRRIWLIHSRGRQQPLGAAIVYRGPLGFNCSLLENRCDLLLSPGLSEEQRIAACRAALHAVTAAYADFPHAAIPVTTDARTAQALVALGGRRLRTHSQCILLRGGYAAWYQRVGQFYTRVEKGTKRFGGPRLIPATEHETDAA